MSAHFFNSLTGMVWWSRIFGALSLGSISIICKTNRISSSSSRLCKAGNIFQCPLSHRLGYCILRLLFILSLPTGYLSLWYVPLPCTTNLICTITSLPHPPLLVPTPPCIITSLTSLIPTPAPPLCRNLAMSKLTPICCWHVKMGLLGSSSNSSNHPAFQKGTTQFLGSFRFTLFAAADITTNGSSG